MKKRCLNRRGYFFLIDSILAVGVLGIGIFFIFSIYLNVPSKEEPELLSDDIMDFFSNNKIKNIDNTYAGLGGDLWNTEGELGGLCPGEELIANPDNTLLQQVAEFYSISQGIPPKPCYWNPNNPTTDPDDLAEKLIFNLTYGSLPSQYDFEFWLDEQLMYPAQPQTSLKDAAKVIIPSKKIVYGFVDKETGEMFGPYSVEVLVWQ